MRGKLCLPRGIVQYGIQWLFGSDSGRESGSARLGAPALFLFLCKIPGGYWVMRSISATRTLILRTEESTAEIMGALD